MLKIFLLVVKYGTCIICDPAALETLITVTLPVFLSCVITVSLDVYLTIKAYQICKKIQEESKLSGGQRRNDDEFKALKKKEANSKKNLKPVIILLVVMMGNAMFGLLIPILIIPTAYLDSPEVCKSFIHNVIIPNLAYVAFLLHLFAYALYFKQIRDPMMRLLKRVTCPCKCQSAADAPWPQNNKINWLNPN